VSWDDRVWNEVSVNTLIKFCYTADEYESAVWTDEVSQCCPEPWKFHIDTWDYIVAERYKGGYMMAFKINKDCRENCIIEELSRHELRDLSEDKEKINIWAIDLDGLIQMVSRERVYYEDIEDIDALEAWTLYQNGYSTDEIASDYFKMLEEKVEQYYEMEADRRMGK
jgi:hypothetical protein